MGSTGFQLAFDEAIRTNRFDRTDVGDRMLLGRIGRFDSGGFRSTMSIAPIADQDGIKGLLLGVAVDDGMVLAHNAVMLEGFDERLSDARCAGKEHQARGVTIQSMHGDDLDSLEFMFEILAFLGPNVLELARANRQSFGTFLGWILILPGFGVAFEVMQQCQRDEFFESGLELPPFFREVSFFEVSDAGDPCGFFHDHQELIDVGDPNVGRFDRFRERFVPELDDVFGGDFTDRVKA